MGAPVDKEAQFVHVAAGSIPPALPNMPSLHLPIRPRRNRQTPAIRDLVRETDLTPQHLIYPLFIQEGDENTPIAAMPGCQRWCVEDLVNEAGSAHSLGIPAASEPHWTKKATPMSPS